MNRRNTIISIVVVLAVAGFIFYRQFASEQALRSEDTSAVRDEAAVRELYDVVTYDVPGGTHTIQFTISVDGAGVVQDFTALDTTDPDHQQKVREFYMTLAPKIEGKKLEELEAVDKVGTSSLTTEAFNTALENIQTLL